MASFAPGNVGGSTHLSASGVISTCDCWASPGITPTRRTSSTVGRIRRMVDPSMRNILIDSVVFDLDGTLWDTSATCAMGWNRVLERLGIPFRPITEHDVRRVTGTPHEQGIRGVFAGPPGGHLAAPAAETAVVDVRLIGERGGDLFPDVPAGLQRLAARYPLFIVSNCQAGYIEAFQRWSGLGACFRDFECWGNT